MSGRAEVEALLKLVNSAAQDALVQYEKHGSEVPAISSTTSHPLDTSDDSLELRKAIRVLEGACEQLCSSLAPPIHTIVNKGQNLDWLCLLVVIQAGVADALSGHETGMHVNDLSKSVGVESAKLARILRALATKHIFTEVKPDVFANNRLSQVLLSSNDVACLTVLHTTLAPRAATILYDNLSNPRTALSYDPKDSPFMQAVKSEGVFGSFFDWLKVHPDKRATFGRAMLGLGQVMGSLSILHYYPWSAYSTHWSQNLPETRVRDQVQFLSGDFFERLPVKNQDIYYVRNVIHNWPDAQAQKILTTIREAMGNGSRLLIHDYVLSHISQTELEAARVERAPSPLLPNYGAGSARTYNQDMTMLIMYISKERTLDESVALASTVGLQLEKVWDLAESSLLEFKVAE
ncbi:hypothetical protein H0H92_008767 [Tricholoma furcatifolium]|nr:hypothetical protein H0H92_008767 [Tricholoma furcatifolium]